MTEETPMQPGSVPIVELEELIEEWRVFAEPSGWDEYSKGVREGIEASAKDLERVLEEHKHD